MEILPKYAVVVIFSFRHRSVYLHKYIEAQEEIKTLAWKAYVSCKGTGYTRADIRMDNITKKMYVLEVNAQCGLSEDEDYTSIGAILKVSNQSFSSLVSEILYNAITKNQ